ncbi:SDR family oxidoreductase [Pseudonocardia sp. GCM10023141]|uniref:SDR family oxidoreductase n=1 Tax=Pseudonocardia sp. GCM10023141 TaxID=3252653 RepID=UPI003619DFE2
MDGAGVDGRGVVVTGGGNGIGRAIATRMAAGGARVVVNDLDAGAAAEVAAVIGGVAVPGDAATEAGVAALVEAATAELGTIDIFFANAGIGGGGGLLETTEAQWARALEVNVLAHVRAARLLVPGWVERGGGRFVVTASAAGLLTQIGSAPYSVTKHAAVAFAEWLAVTYGDDGVVAQCLCPQGVRTQMLDSTGVMRDMISHDGELEPEQVAEVVWDALHDDRFLILPHEKVRDYYSFKAASTDRWLGGMRKLKRRVDAARG